MRHEWPQKTVAIVRRPISWRTSSKAEPFEKPAKTALPGKMTYEEFLAWADEDTWAEWSMGR